MNDFEIYWIARNRLETLWRQAERQARLFAVESDLGADPEALTSRATGGRV